MLEVLFYALGIMALIGVAITLVTFIAILFVFLEVFRLSWKKQEEYLSPVGKEAKEWKEEVERKKGKPNENI